MEPRGYSPWRRQRGQRPDRDAGSLLTYVAEKYRFLKGGAGELVAWSFSAETPSSLLPEMSGDKMKIFCRGEPAARPCGGTFTVKKRKFVRIKLGKGASRNYLLTMVSEAAA
jgi:hypothetical protein